MTVKIPSLYILVTNIIVKNQNLKKKKLATSTVVSATRIESITGKKTHNHNAVVLIFALWVLSNRPSVCTSSYNSKTKLRR